MGLNNLTDVILNLIVFAFIGFLVWLYLKPEEKKPPKG